MKIHEMRELIKLINYKDFKIIILDDMSLVLEFKHGPITQRSRKWRLSEFMTKSEIVQTCLKAVLTVEEHEAREEFMFKGESIFGPHFDVDELYELCLGGALDKREPLRKEFEA